VRLAVVVLLVSLTIPTMGEASTSVGISGGRFLLNGTVSYPGAPAEGRLLNVRMVNSVFEDTTRSDFDPDGNTNEFITAMPAYVSHGVRAFTLSLQGGNPAYEGAVNTAFRADGSLKAAYLARVKRVIQAADSLGAVIILGLYYQRQDQHLANDAAIRAGVVNVANWVTQEGFTNIMLEIANEYPHGGYDHPLIQSGSGMASLIRLAKTTAPQLYVSASGVGDGSLDADVAQAADYLLIHFNDTPVNSYSSKITSLQGYGKPIVVNEDPKEGGEGASAAQAAVNSGASWGFFLRLNQNYPFEFFGPADDPTVYANLRNLASPGGMSSPVAPSQLTIR
jgi:hypothetical protein